MEEIRKAVLVGLRTPENDIEKSIKELKALANACDMEVLGIMDQFLERPVAATYIGKGKAEEVSEMCENMEADVCIFEDTLSPAQHKNLQKIIKAQIIDRTGLILEIFSKRAKTREAKLQVETAKLQYMMPRLIGMWEAIGRQGGASGSKSNKGIGETQLELDRRWIQKRLTVLKRELNTIEHDRMVQRGRRSRSELPLVALVGYTNAGKSTIMNRILGTSEGRTEKMVFEEDMLFATLDTSIRKVTFKDRKDFLLSDTVGFVNRLPHSLVKAFRSTLEEIKYADLLVQVVDYSDENYEDQMRVTLETLREIGAENIPMIFVMNKLDKCMDKEIYKPFIRNDKIYMSAGPCEGIDSLIEMIKDRIYPDMETVSIMVPYDKGSLINELNVNSRIISQEYTEDGVLICTEISKAVRGRLGI